MADVEQQILNAVGTALNVSAVTTLATGGVHLSKADKNSDLPYAVFDTQAFDENEYTFGFGQTFEGGLILVKAYADRKSDTSKAPQTLNREILEACKTILHGSLSLATSDLLWMRKFSDVKLPDEKPLKGERTIYGAGTLYKYKVKE